MPSSDHPQATPSYCDYIHYCHCTTVYRIEPHIQQSNGSICVRQHHSTRFGVEHRLLLSFMLPLPLSLLLLLRLLRCCGGIQTISIVCVRASDNECRVRVNETMRSLSCDECVRECDAGCGYVRMCVFIEAPGCRNTTTPTTTLNDDIPQPLTFICAPHRAHSHDRA